MTKLLAWNLRHGGGGRGMPAIVLTLLEHAPDVLVLTEFRTATGGQIAGVLADHGWRHQHSTRPPKGTNGVLVAARTPLKVVEADWGQSARLLPESCRRRYVEVELPELSLALAGVHIPCDGKGLGREAVFQQVVGAARRRREERFIVLGDFNAGRHHLDEEGATFTCTRCLGQLAALGYCDAWREVNGSRREYSWFSHEGTGFRIDHAYVSAALRGELKACWYSHQERQRGVSDHSLLVVQVEAGSGADVKTPVFFRRF